MSIPYTEAPPDPDLAETQKRFRVRIEQEFGAHMRTRLAKSLFATDANGDPLMSLESGTRHTEVILAFSPNNEFEKITHISEVDFQAKRCFMVKKENLTFVHEQVSFHWTHVLYNVMSMADKHEFVRVYQHLGCGPGEPAFTFQFIIVVPYSRLSYWHLTTRGHKGVPGVRYGKPGLIMQI